VTGASRGIGKAIALHLASRGWGLTITARSSDALAEVADDLESVGSPRVQQFATNVGGGNDLALLVQQHARTFSSMNALVLNAGTGSVGRADEVDLRSYGRMVEVNLTSTMILVREAMPLLRAAARADPGRGARDIALASIAGVFAEPGLASYGATKAALISFIETLNAEVSGSGVMATALAPGYVNTDMSAWVTERIPADKMIPIADVVAFVEFLTELSSVTSVPRLVLTRSGTSGLEA
jgi:short-subunit dehydrogenase